MANNIKLARFSVAKAPVQGVALHNFVQSERGWLRDFHWDTAERGRNLHHAVYNVGRLAVLTRREGERFSYLVQERGRALRALGTATIILDSKVVNPLLADETIHAHDLGYVVRAGTDDATHDAVARELAEEAWRLHELGYGEQNTTPGFPPSAFRLMATIDPDNPHPASGLTRLPHMYHAWIPGQLQTPDGEDYHQLAKGGVNLQLYVTPPITELGG